MGTSSDYHSKIKRLVLGLAVMCWLLWVLWIVVILVLEVLVMLTLQGDRGSYAGTDQFAKSKF